MPNVIDIKNKTPDGQVRFKQIAVCSTSTMSSTLFGLDEKGVVWKQSGDGWVKMNMKIK